ncbi:MAG: serine hydrolase, partial [Candidatus Thorarchaeota archaeon]
MESEKQIEIIGKEKDSIAKRIKRIENNLPQITLKNGIPFAIWDDIGSLEARMKTFNVPGISMAIINGYELEWLMSLGKRDVRTNEKVTFETLFEGGSTAKSITAAVIL